MLQRNFITVAFLSVCVSVAFAETNGANNSLRYGERQVEQMLDDRPAMKPILQSNNGLRNWLVNAFAADGDGHRVFWDTRPTFSKRPAESNSAHGYGPSCVRISNESNLTGNDQVYMVVYELINVSQSTYFRRLFADAKAGKLTRDEYVMRCVRGEFDTAMKTKAVFAEHPIVGADVTNAPHYVTRLKRSENFDDYIAWLDTRPPEKYDHRRFFATQFDNLTRNQEGGEP